MKTFQLLSLTLLLTSALTNPAAAERTLARLFWQDDATAMVRWGDLTRSDGKYFLSNQPINKFPSIDADEQSLVQMQMHDGVLLTGVHDSSGGESASGWIAVDSGVTEVPHGDHSHWHYDAEPSVMMSLIDKSQGNPAHVYDYDGTFVLANDKKNGFTLVSPQSIRAAATPAEAGEFIEGGNGHITLAVIDNLVAYATWIARDGDDCGRVDVVGLGENAGKRYDFRCPTGALHGATTAGGKVFFAPADGVCWVTADVDLVQTNDDVMVHQLSLGSDENGPLRTGAFANHGDHVLMTYGKGESTSLGIIDAAADQPELIQLPIELADGQSASPPIPLSARGGKPMVMVFAESADAPAKDQLRLIGLGPNGDGCFDDAHLVWSTEVGPNLISGHSGHHDAAMLPGGRHVAVTNPGDGSVWIISLTDGSVTAKLNCGGEPTRLLVAG